MITREEIKLAQEALKHIDQCSSNIENNLREFVSRGALDRQSARLIGDSTGLAVSIKDTWLQPLRGLLEKLQN